MQVVIELLFMVFKAAIFGALAAALTALCTGQGALMMTFGARFKAAYPAWFAALLLLTAGYLYVGMQGLPPSSLPGVLIIGCLGVGGWAALRSVRAARARAAIS